MPPEALKLVYVPVGDLGAMVGNPRKNDAAIPKVMESIKRFGWTNPILARREDKVVVAGHTRLEAAKALGLEQVPVIWLDLDPVSSRLYNLADNRLNEVAEWDDDALAAILTELLAEDAEGVAIAGFGDEDIEALLREVNGDPKLAGDPDEAPDVSEKPWVKLGDLFTLGDHRLLCGDSTKPEDVARVMAGEKAACMWTDPPYGVSYQGGTKKKLRILNDGAEGLEALINGAFGCANEALADGAAIYVAHPAGPNSVTFGVSFVAAGWRLHETLVWVKDSLVLGHSDYHYRHEPILFGYRPAKGRRGRGGEGWYGDDSQTTVLEVPRPKRSEAHPCLRPGSQVLTEIGWRAIEMLSVGERVLTADGYFEAIEHVSSHPCEGPLYRIGVEGSGELVDATGNHPFLIVRHGQLAWAEASQLRVGDELASPLSHDHPRSAACPPGASIPAAPGARRSRATTGSTSRAATGWLTSSPGSGPMAPSPAASRCTTATGTSRTMTCPTSCWSRPLSTSGFTPVATCKTASGGSHAGCAVCGSRSRPSTGTSPGAAGSVGTDASPVTSPGWSRFALHRVVRAERIAYSGLVWNLSVEGSPTFQTRVGTSHNTMKPVELITRTLSNSTRKGDLVYEPFSGSGSTLMACEVLGRKARAIELDPRFVQVAIERWELATGKKAVAHQPNEEA
jgi:site-specific DNA-methyltransferase (adenine-specific)